jgi:ketosteroid isomerase-like protein
MAVIAEVTLRGVSREQYDAVRERVGWLAQVPEGGLAHLTWWDGQDCRNVDSWESEAAFAAFGEQRLGPALAALGIEVAPEVIFHPAHSLRYGGRYTGPQGVAQFLAALAENFAELTVAPETFVDGGDAVVVIGTHRGTTRMGTAFDSPFVHVWAWRAGKAISFSEFFDTAPLLPDLGRPADAGDVVHAGSAAR